MTKERVFPLHKDDSERHLFKFILKFMFRFDEQLDAQVLKESLEELLRQDGWCKLAGRLRRNVDGDLEYFVPSELDQGRNLFRFSHLNIEGGIKEHAIAGTIPRAGGEKPRVLCSSKEYESLMEEDSDRVPCMEWMIQHKLPQLGVRIITFQDATLISLTCFHYVLDATGMGMDGLLGAWMLVLQGRKSELPPLCGVDEDLLGNLGKNPIEPYKLAHRVMGGLETLAWGLRHIISGVFHKQQEEKVVFVPAGWLRQLRDSVLRDLAIEAANEGRKSEEPPFVSEGDVLVAWWARYAVRHLRKKTNKTVAIGNAYNMRQVLSGRLLPKNHFYPSNAVSMLFVLSNVGEVLKRPISWLAKSVRQAITEMGTFEQTAAMRHTFSQGEKGFLKQRMLGDIGMKPIYVTNWTKAKFFEFDVSAAISKSRLGRITEEIPGHCHNRVLPSYFSGLICYVKKRPSDFCTILGKDNEGNYWLNGALPRETWEAIEEEFEKQPAGVQR